MAAMCILECTHNPLSRICMQIGSFERQKKTIYLAPFFSDMSFFYILLISFSTELFSSIFNRTYTSIKYLYWSENVAAGNVILQGHTWKRPLDLFFFSEDSVRIFLRFSAV